MELQLKVVKMNCNNVTNCGTTLELRLQGVKKYRNFATNSATIMELQVQGVKSTALLLLIVVQSRSYSYKGKKEQQF